MQINPLTEYIGMSVTPCLSENRRKDNKQKRSKNVSSTYRQREVSSCPPCAAFGIAVVLVPTLSFAAQTRFSSRKGRNCRHKKKVTTK